MRFVVFTLAGALASFGVQAGNAHRGTQARPTHSMVAGLISAALGIRHGEEDRLAALSEALRIASRTDAPGTLLVDYHTVQSADDAKRGSKPASRAAVLGAPRLNTTLTTREYLAGVRFTVAATIEGWAAGDEEAVAQALRRPHFVLYLGRKSCPLALPLDPCVVAADDPQQAFEAYDLLCVDHARAVWPSREARVAHDARLPSSATPHRRETRRTRPRGRSGWTFDPLDELVLVPRDDPA